MAEKNVSVELTAMEKQWVAKALSSLGQALMRSRGKEIVGSEIHALRGKEIEALNALSNKFI